ncbi:MAG: hypothetical protein IJH61_03460, partial [Eubacteriaceae bacterium]|nr:hypothetical protein [Eubacteriaceae bacterium]
MPRTANGEYHVAETFRLSFLGSFLALLENICSERLFLTHAPLVTLGAYPSVAFGDSSPYQWE